MAHLRHQPLRSRCGYPLHPGNAGAQFYPHHGNLHPCFHSKAAGHSDEQASEEGFQGGVKIEKDCLQRLYEGAS